MNRRQLLKFLGAGTLASQVPLRTYAAARILGDAPEMLAGSWKIVGVGTWGCRMLDLMIKKGVSFSSRRQSYLAINRTANGLSLATTDQTGWLKESISWRADDNPDEIDRNESAALRSVVGKPDKVLLIAGLGEGLGIGIAPAVAKFSKESGAMVVAFALTPSPFLQHRPVLADDALFHFRCAYMDRIHVTDQGELMRQLLADQPDISLGEHSKKVDEQVMDRIMYAIQTPSQ